MTDQTDSANTTPFPTPSLEDIQHWTFVMGRARRMMMAHLAARGARLHAVAASCYAAASLDSTGGAP